MRIRSVSSEFSLKNKHRTVTENGTVPIEVTRFGPYLGSHFELCEVALTSKERIAFERGFESVSALGSFLL